MASQPEGTGGRHISSRIFQDYTVEFVEILRGYLNCKNCRKEIFHEDEHNGICSYCKKSFTSLEENFSFNLYLEKDGIHEEIRGFRKNVDEFGSSFPPDLDIYDLHDLEIRLETFFVGKKMTVEYTGVLPVNCSEVDRVTRKRGQKFIHKIHQITKPENLELKV